MTKIRAISRVENKFVQVSIHSGNHRKQHDTEFELGMEIYQLTKKRSRPTQNSKMIKFNQNCKNDKDLRIHAEIFPMSWYCKIPATVSGR